MQARWNCDYLVKNKIMDPWASVNYIAQRAQQVKLCREKLEEAADNIFKRIADGGLEVAFIRPSGIHVFNDVKLPLKAAIDRFGISGEPNTSGGITCRKFYWCFVCAMSFSFWSDFVPGDRKYMVKSPDGLLWKGSKAIMARFNQLFRCNVPLNADAFEFMPFNVFNYFMMNRTGALPPMMEERYQVVKEVATVLNKKFDGSFYNCVRKANNDPIGLMSLVLENFPCFRDIAEYNGQKVCFLMKAQLLILGVSVLLEENKDSVAINCNDYYFIISSNHRNVQMMRHYGALIPSSEIENRMKENKMFTYGEPAEVEMRAMACKSMQIITETINDKLKKSGNAIRVDYLDVDSFVDMDRIWSVAKIQRGQILFPRTRNIFY